jgi:hypothetical protein
MEAFSSMKSDPRRFVIDSQQPSVAPRAVAPRRRQRLGLIAPPVFLGGVRKPEPISSPFHSNYVKSFAGCWWGRRPRDRNEIPRVNVAGDAGTSAKDRRTAAERRRGDRLRGGRTDAKGPY